MTPPLPPLWEAEESYAVGDRCNWEDAILICTKAHYAGASAEHPWDPGDGWAEEKAATLWTPVSEEARSLLLAAASEAMEREEPPENPDVVRYCAVILCACGVT